MDGMSVCLDKSPDGTYSALPGLGTIHYSGPENQSYMTYAERRAAASTKSADVHCVGACLWAMLVGAKLTPGEDIYTKWPVSGRLCC